MDSVMMAVPVSSIKKSGYRHPPFGPEYRPFFERMSFLFADIVPGTPEEWEDDFRRDTNPEREMAIWKDLADIYEHFTGGRRWNLARRKELFSVLLTCLSEGPKAALRVDLRHLARRQVKDIVNYATRAKQGQGHSSAGG